MKKILIITYYYKHKNAMASVRAIKLAKFFARGGNEVTVLTSNQKDTWTNDYLEPVPDETIREIYAPQHPRWTLIHKYLSHRGNVGEKKRAQAEQADVAEQAAPKKKRFKEKLREKLVWLFYFNLAKQEDICMFKGLKAEYRHQNLGHFDTVIATYPNYGAFLTGMWLKKKGLCEQFIADFRDPLYNPGFRSVKAEANYDKKCLAKVMHAADKAVCVSRGISQGIERELPSTRQKLCVITNGYDKDDVAGNEEALPFGKEKVNFVYTGTLYHGKRCVDMLAEVLKELVEAGTIQTNAFSFEYAGPDFEELLTQLKEYGLESTAVDHGFVPRQRAIAMQKSASALLLLTWNEKDYQGVVPGKLYEYMAIGTAPIIALVTGDVPESEVALKIRETESGIACEQAALAKDKPLLKAYITQLFEGTLAFSSNVSEYNYQSISQKYLEIM